MKQLLKKMNNKIVYIWGTSPFISKLLLEPYDIEVVSNVSIKIGEVRSCAFEDLIVNLSIEKKEKILNIWNDLKLNKEQNFHIGLNLFSCFFPTDVAWWADPANFLTRELLNKSFSKYLITLQDTLTRDEKILDNNNQYIYKPFENINRIYATFEFSGRREDCKLGIIDTEYTGYLWWWRSCVFGAIHAACLGGAKEIYIGGVDLNPLIGNHFYEVVNFNNQYNWAQMQVIDIAKKFITLFPDTQIFKLNSKSYLPFKYKSLEKSLND